MQQILQHFHKISIGRRSSRSDSSETVAATRLPTLSNAVGMRDDPSVLATASVADF
jgi:hypothetical protein